MAPRSNRRYSHDDIKADREMLMALKNINDYRPINPSYDIATLSHLAEVLSEAERARLSAEIRLDAARDQMMAAVHALHEGLIGAKQQVLAQYGPDSYEIQAMGLKRKSDRKRPTRRQEQEV